MFVITRISLESRFVILKFYSIHLTVILAGLKKTIHYVSPATSLHRVSLNEGSIVIIICTK